MASYEIETPDGAVYQIDAENEEQLHSTIAHLTSPAAKAEKKPDPSEGGGTLRLGPLDTGVKTPQWIERGLAGTGKAFSDIGRGISQANTEFNLRNFPPDVKERAIQAMQAQSDQVKKLDAPLMATTAGKVGNVAGNVALAAPTAFIPGVNTYAGSAALGGVMGAIQPVGSGDSRAMNVGLGAGGAMAGKYLGDRLGSLVRQPTPATTANAGAQANVAGQATATPGVATTQTTATGAANATGSGGGFNFGTVGSDPSAGLNAAQRAAMQGGQALGMRVTPGQATGSRSLQQLEAKLESQPMTSGAFNSIKDANQRVLNRATAHAIGETSDTVDATVLARANDRLAAVFNDVRDGTPRSIDPQGFVGHIQSVNDEFEGLLPGGSTITAHPLVQRLTRYAESGSATGEQLGGLTSKLGRAAHKEMTSASGDREMGQALYMVKDYVDDLVEQGLSGERLAAYQSARGQYRNLLNITKVGVLNPSTGNVSGATLANTLQRTDKNGFLFGRNNTDMYAAARFAQAFKPIIGDSGTATRSTLASPTDFVLSLPFNIATRAYTSSPAINLAVGGQATANAAGRAVAPMANPIFRQAPRVLPVAGGLLGANSSR